jgi:hypothetical protein
LEKTLTEKKIKKEKCTIKKKLDTIQDVLMELDCLPRSRWVTYWESHMPEVSDEEKELLPE